jgi:hypothetical protein
MALRILSAAVAAFAALSATWFAWGIGIPGEHFGRAGMLVTPSLIVAALIGGWCGFRAAGRWRLLVYAFGLVSLCFWVIVP